MPPKTVSLYPGHHLIHGSLTPLKSTAQTAPRSVHPFSTAHSCDQHTDRQTHRPRYICNNRPRIYVLHACSWLTWDNGDRPPLQTRWLATILSRYGVNLWSEWSLNMIRLESSIWGGGGGWWRKAWAWLGSMTCVGGGVYATATHLLRTFLYALYFFLIFSLHCHSGNFKIGLSGTIGDNVYAIHIFGYFVFLL